MGVKRLVSADSESGKLPDVVLSNLDERNPNFVNGIKSQGLNGAQVPVMSGNGQASLINWRVDAGTGSEYAVHITSGPLFAGAGLIGLGADYGNKPALLVNNKASGAGVVIHNQSTVASGASGLFGLNSSPVQPFMRLQQEAGSARGVLFQMIGSTTNKDSHLFELQNFNGTVLTWMDNAGGQHFTEDSYFNESVISSDATANHHRFYGRAAASASGPWWPFEVAQEQNISYLRGGAATGTKGAESYSRTFMSMDSNTGAIGFFGVAPVSRRPLPSTGVTVEQIAQALTEIGIAYRS